MKKQTVLLVWSSDCSSRQNKSFMGSTATLLTHCRVRWSSHYFCNFISVCFSILVRTALLAIIGFMPTKGEGAIGSLDYTPEERRALAKKSQDFCCEMCGTSMKTALLPLTSGSGSSQADKEAKELARQISFKAEVHSSRKSEAEPSNSAGLNCSATSPEPQQDGATQAFRGPASAMSETQPSSTAPGQERAPSVPTNTSLSPRQRRAQQHSQRWAPASTDFNRVQQPRANPNHTGSTVLIVLLTFALAALIFRRICLANEYIFWVIRSFLL